VAVDQIGREVRRADAVDVTATSVALFRPDGSLWTYSYDGANKQIMLDLLESGKDVVTANKALIAEHGPELFDRARALDLCIAFEAAVAGGIPIIANISQCLSANQIQSLRGILNGTSNFAKEEPVLPNPMIPTFLPLNSVPRFASRIHFPCFTSS